MNEAVESYRKMFLLAVNPSSLQYARTHLTKPLPPAPRFPTAAQRKQLADAINPTTLLAGIRALHSGSSQQQHQKQNHHHPSPQQQPHRQQPQRGPPPPPRNPEEIQRDLIRRNSFNQQQSQPQQQSEPRQEQPQSLFSQPPPTTKSQPTHQSPSQPHQSKNTSATRDDSYVLLDRLKVDEKQDQDDPNIPPTIDKASKSGAILQSITRSRGGKKKHGRSPR